MLTTGQSAPITSSNRWCKDFFCNFFASQGLTKVEYFQVELLGSNISGWTFLVKPFWACSTDLYCSDWSQIFSLFSFYYPQWTPVDSLLDTIQWILSTFCSQHFMCSIVCQFVRLPSAVDCKCFVCRWPEILNFEISEDLNPSTNLSSV